MVGIVRRWLRTAAGDLTAAAVELTELDARIGDGDHGINLRRGMDAIRTMLDEADEDADAADLLRQAGRRLISVVGGASGPLYGTLLIAAADGLGDDATHVADLARALEEGVAAVGRRGRSKLGQKTMLDTLVPATARLASALAAGSPADEAGRAAAVDARAGRDGTRDMVAQRGRASYLGERSRGHIDPGAASASILIEALSAALSDQPAASTPAMASR